MENSDSVLFHFVLFLREKEGECHCCVLLATTVSNFAGSMWVVDVTGKYFPSWLLFFLLRFAVKFMQSLDMKTK